VPLLVIARLAMNGANPWQSTVGIVHSLLLVALAVGAVAAAARSMTAGRVPGEEETPNADVGSQRT
jgi:MFS-type transporter involved in bile tolerance (Atg22 family)